MAWLSLVNEGVLLPEMIKAFINTGLCIAWKEWLLNIVQFNDGETF
jgi:hypothetical protein